MPKVKLTKDKFNKYKKMNEVVVNYYNIIAQYDNAINEEDKTKFLNEKEVFLSKNKDILNEYEDILSNQNKIEQRLEYYKFLSESAKHSRKKHKDNYNNWVKEHDAVKDETGHYLNEKDFNAKWTKARIDANIPQTQQNQKENNNEIKAQPKVKKYSEVDLNIIETLKLNKINPELIKLVVKFRHKYKIILADEVKAYNKLAQSTIQKEYTVDKRSGQKNIKVLNQTSLSVFAVNYKNQYKVDLNNALAKLMASKKFDHKASTLNEFINDFEKIIKLSVTNSANLKPLNYGGMSKEEYQDLICTATNTVIKVDNNYFKNILVNSTERDYHDMNLNKINEILEQTSINYVNSVKKASNLRDNTFKTINIIGNIKDSVKVLENIKYSHNIFYRWFHPSMFKPINDTIEAMKNLVLSTCYFKGNPLEKETYNYLLDHDATSKVLPIENKTLEDYIVENKRFDSDLSKYSIEEVLEYEEELDDVNKIYDCEVDVNTSVNISVDELNESIDESDVSFDDDNELNEGFELSEEEALEFQKELNK